MNEEVESRRKRNGSCPVKVCLGDISNQWNIPVAGILVGLSGTQVILLREAWVLPMSIGRVCFPRAGLAKEWGEGMTNYIASWVVFMNRAKKNTAVQRPQ